MLKSKLIIPLAFLYIGIALIISPVFMFHYDLRDIYYSLTRQFGTIFIFTGIVYIFFDRLSSKVDTIDSRMKELDKAGIDEIKIEDKSFFRHIFDELGNKNFIVDLKVLADIETINASLYFIKDFLKNRRYDTKVTIIISKPADDEFEMYVIHAITELFEIAKQKTNKSITIRVTKERLNYNAIIYDSNIWLTFSGKREFENSISINTRVNSLFGKQVTDFFEFLTSKSSLLDKNP